MTRRPPHVALGVRRHQCGRHLEPVRRGRRGSGRRLDRQLVPRPDPAGRHQPYPGELPVSGLPDGITDVDVTVQGFTHPYPDDVDLMLVGPTGRRVLLMSDAGGGGDAGHEAADVDLSFDDEAGSAVPDDGPLESTSYRPANYGHDDVFPAPAPGAGGAGSSLGVFDGTDPNGIWRLFAVDQMTGGEGEITGGWRLVISTVAEPPRAPPRARRPCRPCHPRQRPGRLLPPAARSAAARLPATRSGPRSWGRARSRGRSGSGSARRCALWSTSASTPRP